MESDELGIIVAVGPDRVHGGTLDLAAAEALRRGTGVELLHVVHSVIALPSYQGQVLELDQALLEVGRSVLADAAERMGPLLRGEVPLSTELLVGPVAATIAHRGETRDLVVLERRAPQHLERLLTMSVSTRVAAHTTAPVVVVPQGWVPAAADLPVTVGIDRPSDPLGQVETAASYAALHGRDITVLFAIWLAEPYQDVVFVNHTRRQWTHEADSELRLALEKLDDPGVPVTRKVLWARPADALVAASRRSAALVLSRRPHRSRHGVHLGPVTRTVLRHAECPVLVFDRT